MSGAEDARLAALRREGRIRGARGDYVSWTEAIRRDGGKDPKAAINWQKNPIKLAGGQEGEALYVTKAGIGNPVTPIKRNGYAAADIDGTGGSEHHDKLTAGADLPMTVTVRTPGKVKDGEWVGFGEHRIFLAEPGDPARLDFEADGRITVRAPEPEKDAYVLAPGSLHPDWPEGPIYDYVPGLSPDDIPYAPWPEVYRRIAAEYSSNGSRDKSTGQPAEGPTPEGVIPYLHRDTTLTAIGAAMRRQGMLEIEIAAALVVVNERCDPPLQETQVRKIARSMAGYPAGDPALARIIKMGKIIDHAPWPEPLAPAAYHGITGQFVRLVEPHTEADPAALAIQFLVGVGNLIGRGPHMIIGADRLGLNLATWLVGATSRGRKGTSESWVRAFLRLVEPAWVDDRMQSGLSSGEGLIYAVRDAMTKVNKKGETEVIDAGESDKRLLAIEPEGARVLRNAKRETNTLSAQVRQALDAQHVMRTMTKNNGLKATDAHISMVCHITKEELRLELRSTETANGFANRYVWVATRRSKLLPRGGKLKPASDSFKELAGDLRNIVALTRWLGEFMMSDEAEALWVEVYPKLTADVSGLIGAVTSRAEALVTKAALLYAVLDRSGGRRVSGVIERVHLEAALALWRYCFDSAAHIFGDGAEDIRPVNDFGVRQHSRGPAASEQTFLAGRVVEELTRSPAATIADLARRIGFTSKGKLLNPKNRTLREALDGLIAFERVVHDQADGYRVAPPENSRPDTPQPEDGSDHEDDSTPDTRQPDQPDEVSSAESRVPNERNRTHPSEWKHGGQGLYHPELQRVFRELRRQRDQMHS